LKTQWAQGVVLKSASRPATVNGLEIRQNFPNPFTDRTAVCFTTNKDQKVEVAVYNWLGQKTKTLVNKYMKTGDYSIDWNGTNDAGAVLPKGMYLIQITGSETQGKVAMKLLKN
jgi:flagellar hook assembly protein FlgD